MAIELSIVLPTCNRAELLGRCLESIQAAVSCNYEIIVVDGASSDDTAAVLQRAGGMFGDKLKVIREESRRGFVRAANQGFRAASGKYMTWLNDDARPRPGAMEQAIAQLDASASDVGFLAMFHRWHSMRNIAYETTYDNTVYRLCHVRGTLYANFAIGRRETFQQLGLFDEGYYFCAADPDLSLKAWNAGLTIEPAFGAIIDHDQTPDQRRDNDSMRAKEDNDRLMAKWDLPAKNPFRNDFDPANPCTLRGLRELSRLVAA